MDIKTDACSLLHPGNKTLLEKPSKYSVATGTKEIINDFTIFTNYEMKLDLSMNSTVNFTNGKDMY